MRGNFRLLLVLWLLLCCVLLGWPVVPANALAWDSLNGLGIAALMLLMLCCWLAPTRHAGYQIFGLRAHIGLSVMVLIATTVHALGLLVTNDVAIEYLKWRAPGYMHAGNLAFLIMLAVSIMSIKTVRRVLHNSFDGFRSVHRLLSAVLIGLAAWHIIGSGYLAGSGHGAATAWSKDWTPRLQTYWRGGLLGSLMLLTTVLWWQLPHRYRPGITHNATGVRRGLRLQFIAILLIVTAYLLALQWDQWTGQIGDA